MSYVGDRASQTLTTVKSALRWRRTGMGVLKSSILDQPKQIYGMKEKSMVSGSASEVIKK